jgi:hypothetical protein
LLVDSGVAGDLITNNGTYSTGGVEPGATVEYSTDGSNWGTTAPVAVEGSNTIFARQTDVAGNTSQSSSLTFTLDTTANITVSLDDVTSSNVANAPISGTSDAGPDRTVTLTITDANGNTVTTSAITGADGRYSTTADLSGLDDGDISVTASVTDAAGNPAEAFSDATLDTQAPSLDITLSDNNLSLGESTTVTFTFSEAPAGFEAADISSPNGTLTGLTQDINNPAVWTATFTPNANYAGGANISVADGTYIDAAGNAGTGDSANLAINTQDSNPIAVSDTVTVVLGSTPTELNNGNTIPILDPGAGVNNQYQDTTQAFTTQADDTVSLTLAISNFTDSSFSGGKLRSDKVTVDIFAPDTNQVVNSLHLEYLNGSWVSNNGAAISLSTSGGVTTVQVTYSGVSAGQYKVGFTLNDGTQNNVKLSLVASDLKLGTSTETVYYPNLGADPVTLAANTIQGNLFTNDYLGTSGATIEAIGSATPVGGVITIATSYGTLSVNATSGAYTYTLNTGSSAPTAGITESFTYTLKGTDGTESQANLNINFANSLSNTATAGADALFGQSVSGGAGDDHIVGTSAGSTLLGGQGSDTLEGGSGTDTLNGGTGNDYLNSGAGNDILIGGEGDDILFGGAGADTFVWQASDLGNDVIKDFKSSEGDRIDLRDLLSTVDEADLSNYLRLDGDTSTLLISTTGAFGSGGAADITIKVENDGGNVFTSSDAISSLIAGGDLLIKTPQD